MNVELATARIDGAIDDFLAARYPGLDLVQLVGNSIQEHEWRLARSLMDLRNARNTPDPFVLGETRCADCEKVMGDEPSVYDDEEVCQACGPQPDASASPPQEGESK